jgi:hypothetical protein
MFRMIAAVLWITLLITDQMFHVFAILFQNLSEYQLKNQGVQDGCRIKATFLEERQNNFPKLTFY